ncbi:MAG: type IV toxin-antitoxin system AbiEi family antitoxin domain-containing protein [Candidatus Helarchaeota archaeon]
MNENIYLSKFEQEIYNPLFKSDEWIITNKQIKDMFYNKSDATINKIISGLIKKGYLYKIKRGMYLIQKEPSPKPLMKDPFELGLNLYKGYLAFGTALRIYDLIDHESFTIYMVTPRISRRKSIGQYEFRAIAFGKKATGITHYKKYYISTIEKTFFDCFLKPQHAGGYGEITKALYLQERLNWKEFLGYMQMFSTSSTCQKIGYVLDLLKRETDFDVPENVLRYLKKRIKTKTKLISTRKSVGKYEKNWKIIDNLGKKRILAWWYHG